ncbi:bacteriocin [candidate division KSB1 bacterium]|nr:bacteriocin [candidate division KSB1 bacterium]
MDILKRSLAPVTEKAWEEIDEQARQVLTGMLSARKFVDVEGPKGWNYAAVPLGRLDVSEDSSEKGVDYGVNKVLPLVETRAFFEIDLWELDNIERGALDIDLSDLEAAAKKMAAFEENAIYNGFQQGHIKGLKEASDHKPLEISGDPEKIPAAVTNGLIKLADESIEGPYYLIVTPELWVKIASYSRGYPLKAQLKELLGGNVIMSPFVNDAFLVTGRGGDFQLVLGQDLSIGFHSADKKKARLFFTESFTFRVIDPAAIVAMNIK